MSNTFLESLPIYESGDVKIHLTAYVSATSNRYSPGKRVEYAVAMTKGPKSTFKSPVNGRIFDHFTDYLEAHHPSLKKPFYDQNDTLFNTVENSKGLSSSALESTIRKIVGVGSEWLRTIDIEKLVQDNLKLIRDGNVRSMQNMMQRLLEYRHRLSRTVRTVNTQCKKLEISKGEFAKMLSECEVHGKGWSRHLPDNFEVLSLLKELYPEEQPK